MSRHPPPCGETSVKKTGFLCLPRFVLVFRHTAGILKEMALRPPPQKSLPCDLLICPIRTNSVPF